MTINQKYFCFIASLIFLTVTFTYSNSKWVNNYKTANIKFRFSLLISSIIMTLPFYIFIGGMLFSDELKYILKIEGIVIIIGSFVTMMVLFPIVMKLVRVPINREKYLNDKKIVINGYKSWRFYILQNPADTFEKMIRLPPWGRNTPDTKTFLKWKWEAERVAPIGIQFLILLFTYIFTTAGLLAIGILKNALFVIYVNVYIMPFLIIVSLTGSFLFWVIKILELIISKLIRKEFKFQQVIKYFLFNGLYVVLISYGLIIIFRK